MIKEIADVSVRIVSMLETRSTGTVHTSAKARLTCVAIRIQISIRIRDPDRHQNLIICSLAHCLPSLKISYNLFKFLCKVANRKTDKQRKLHIHTAISADIAHMWLLADPAFYKCP